MSGPRGVGDLSPVATLGRVRLQEKVNSGAYRVCSHSYLCSREERSEDVLYSSRRPLSSSAHRCCFFYPRPFPSARNGEPRLAPLAFPDAYGNYSSSATLLNGIPYTLQY